MTITECTTCSTLYVRTVAGDLIPIRGAKVSDTIGGHLGTLDYALARTVSGGQRAQAIRVPRSWQVSIADMPAADMGPLLELSAGAYGPGPFGWVTPDMQQGNLVTSDESSWRFGALAPAVLAGPVTSPEGDVVARVVSSSQAVTLASVVPCSQLAPVTASAWVQGSGSSLAVDTLAADGRVIQTLTAGPVSGSSAQRLAITFAPSFREVALSVRAVPGSGGVTAFGAQVTWTPGVVPYVPGLGCRKAVLSGVDVAVLRIRAGEGPWINSGFQVDEVS